MNKHPFEKTFKSIISSYLIVLQTSYLTRNFKRLATFDKKCLNNLKVGFWQ